MSVSTETALDKTTEYLTITYLKTALGIEGHLNDDKLSAVVLEANQEMDSRLQPYVGDSPAEKGTAIYVRARKIAAMYARSIWFESIQQIDRARYNDELYEKKLEGLITSIKAIKTPRTQTVFIGADDSLRRIFQPANSDEYIAREFF